MSRTRKDKFLRDSHKASRRWIHEQDQSLNSDLVLTHSKRLPIRTGANGHRYGNLRKYYAEMKILGRRRRRAQEKDEFQRVFEDKNDESH